MLPLLSILIPKYLYLSCIWIPHTSVSSFSWPLTNRIADFLGLIFSSYSVLTFCVVNHQYEIVGVYLVPIINVLALFFELEHNLLHVNVK